MPDSLSELTLPPIPSDDFSDIKPIGLKPLGPPVDIDALLKPQKTTAELLPPDAFMPDPHDMWRLRMLRDLQMQQQGFAPRPFPPATPEGVPANFHPGEAPGVWNAPGFGPPVLPERKTRPFFPGGKGTFLPFPLDSAPPPNSQAHLMGVPTGGPSNLGKLSQMSGMA